MQLKYFVLGILILHFLATSDRIHTQENTVPFGRTDTASFAKIRGDHGGPGIVRRTDILTGGDFKTDLLFVRAGEILPKSGIGEHAIEGADIMYVLFDGPVTFVRNGRAGTLGAGSMILCTDGASHGMYNGTNSVKRWLAVAVGRDKTEPQTVEVNPSVGEITVESAPPFSTLTLDRDAMSESANAHDGKGPILFRRLFNPDAFTTNWYVVSHAVLPPGSSIGYHRHATREEVYYVISGTGRITVNGKTFDVRAGDASPCPLGGAHGIWNNGEEDLDLLVFSASVEKGVVTGEENLGDDLVGR